ncbi:hypothetical protein G9A89_002340 [Geosiphon pyriformis]|nr:hypothetical protein G9A89_002340 [Geosiphon pyriformis]
MNEVQGTRIKSSIIKESQFPKNVSFLNKSSRNNFSYTILESKMRSFITPKRKNKNDHRNRTKIFEFFIGEIGRRKIQFKKVSKVRKRNEFLKRSLLPISNEYLKMLVRTSGWANKAYCSSNNAVGRFVSGGKVIADVFIDPSTDAIVAYFGGKTLTNQQWKDRKPQLIPYEIRIPSYESQIMVEKIWFEEVEAMKHALFQKIQFLIDSKGFQNERVSIFFTGHGIGGAYAVLAGLSFEHELMNKYRPIGSEDSIFEVFAVTFGQPRIGNEYFAHYVNLFLDVSRITHSNDYVPHYPWNLRSQENLIMIHHEQEHWISYPRCDCILDDYSLFAGLVVFICDGFSHDEQTVGENLECNIGQTETPESEVAHFGPYFGVKMGDCRSYIPDIRPDRPYKLTLTNVTRLTKFSTEVIWLWELKSKQKLEETHPGFELQLKWVRKHLPLKLANVPKTPVWYGLIIVQMLKLYVWVTISERDRIDIRVFTMNLSSHIYHEIPSDHINDNVTRKYGR